MNFNGKESYYDVSVKQKLFSEKQRKYYGLSFVGKCIYCEAHVCLQSLSECADSGTQLPSMAELNSVV